LGRSAPVAIEVAMALAVSWKPLVKSKISAVSTTTTTITATSMCRTLQSTENPAGGRRPHGQVCGMSGCPPNRALDEAAGFRAVIPKLS
jgi:hypothetical protein